MYGITSTANSTGNQSYANRLFIYEVVGLGGDGRNENSLVRKSGTTFITVPYARMNQEMQRITKLGGKIVSIRPAEDAAQIVSEGQSSAQASAQSPMASSTKIVHPKTTDTSVPVNIYRPKTPSSANVSKTTSLLTKAAAAPCVT